jgi:predicted Zn finger-like uncharacterized protein
LFASIGEGSSGVVGMDVRCDRCQTDYELEDENVADGGASVQCTSCGHTFVVSRQGVVRTGTTPTPGPTPGPMLGVNPAPPWTLTTEEGRTHRFRDPTTLQKWIVERRVTRSDRVTPPGGSWRRLGDMEELRPFFEVVDQADRAAAARGLRPTRPETPNRMPGHAQPYGSSYPPAQSSRPYASRDDDDDDVFGGDPEPRERGRDRGRHRGVPSGRFDSDISERVSAIDVDDSMGLDILQPRRPYKKIAAGLVILGLAAGAGYLGFNGLGPWAPSAKSPASAPGAAAADPGASAPGVPAPVAPGAPAPAAPGAPAPPTAPAVARAGSEPPAPAVPPAAAAQVAKGEARRDEAKPEEPKDEPRGPERPSRRARESDEAADPAPGRPRRYEQLVADADRALENGNTGKAQKLFEEALKLQPNGVAAMTGAAYLELDRQRPLAAIGMFKRALASAPAFPQALFGLGEAYRHQGDAAAAVEAYKRYLAVAPSGSDSPAARRQVRELEEQLGARRPGATEAPATP